MPRLGDLAGKLGSGASPTDDESGDTKSDDRASRLARLGMSDPDTVPGHTGVSLKQMISAPRDTPADASQPGPTPEPPHRPRQSAPHRAAVEPTQGSAANLSMTAAREKITNKTTVLVPSSVNDRIKAAAARRYNFRSLLADAAFGSAGDLDVGSREELHDAHRPQDLVQRSLQMGPTLVNRLADLEIAWKMSRSAVVAVLCDSVLDELGY